MDGLMPRPGSVPVLVCLRVTTLTSCPWTTLACEVPLPFHLSDAQTNRAWLLLLCPVMYASNQQGLDSNRCCVYKCLPQTSRALRRLLCPVMFASNQQGLASNHRCVL